MLSAHGGLWLLNPLLPRCLILRPDPVVCSSLSGCRETSDQPCYERLLIVTYFRELSTYKYPVRVAMQVSCCIISKFGYFSIFE